MRLRLLTLLAVALTSSAAGARPPLVCLDAGHGGEKDGAIGAQKQKEKAIALQITRKLRDELLERQVGVLMTRERDVSMDLTDRIERANENQADLFVSVHCNSLPVGPVRNRVHGVETYFLSAEATGEQARRVAEQENAEAGPRRQTGANVAAILEDLAQSEAHRDASVLAYAAHGKLVRALKAPDRGVHQAPFVVLSGARMPAILVEVGFLSHPREARRLADPKYQDRIARALAEGIIDFWEAVSQRAPAEAAAAGP